MFTVGEEVTPMRNTSIKPLLTIFVLIQSLLITNIAIAKDYTYKVRIMAGNIGTVNNEKSVTLECHKGDEIILSDAISAASGDDSNYYHKGFRESGHDEMYPQNSIIVTKDLDLVCAWGLRFDMVNLTVKYIDSATKQPLIADSGASQKTYEYKRGDKPVIAYEHINGYRPLYRNITGTLTEDTTWELEYAAVTENEQTTNTTTDEGTTTTTTTTTTTNTNPTSTTSLQNTTSNTTDTTTTNGNNATGNNTNNQTNGTATGTTGNTTDTTNQSNDNTNQQQDNTPRPTEEIHDLDNPLSIQENDHFNPISMFNDTYATTLPHRMIIIIILSIICIASIVTFFILLFAKKQYEDDENDDDKKEKTNAE